MKELIASNHADHDPETTWSQWVSSLSESSKSVLASSGLDREMYVNGRISFSAILLELFTIEAAV